MKRRVKRRVKRRFKQWEEAKEWPKREKSAEHKQFKRE